MNALERMSSEKRAGRPIDWNKEKILALLEVSDKAVARAVSRIHKNEQLKIREGLTGMGWSRADRSRMEAIAGHLNQGFKLTRGQIKWLRGLDKGATNSRIGKYHRQLLMFWQLKKQGELL